MCDSQVSTNRSFLFYLTPFSDFTCAFCFGLVSLATRSYQVPSLSSPNSHPVRFFSRWSLCNGCRDPFAHPEVVALLVGCWYCGPFFDSELWLYLLNRKAGQSFYALESNMVDVLLLNFLGLNWWAVWSLSFWYCVMAGSRVFRIFGLLVWYHWYAANLKPKFQSLRAGVESNKRI